LTIGAYYLQELIEPLIQMFDYYFRARLTLEDFVQDIDDLLSLSLSYSAVYGQLGSSSRIRDRTWS